MIKTAKEISRFIVATPLICNVNREIVSGLPALADYALLTRQDDKLALAVNLMRKFMPNDPATLFYGSSSRNIGIGAVTDSLEQLLCERDSPLKARAAQILGGKYFNSGQYDQAERLHSIGLGIVSARPTVRIGCLKNLAVLASISGDHRSAVRILEGLIYPAYHLRFVNPTLWLDCINSLAEELRILGNIRRASELIALPLRSKFISRYPEWSDTAQDITNQIKEQRIWIPGYRMSDMEPVAPVLMEPDNLVTLVPTARISRTKGPGRVLRFKRRKSYQISLAAGVVSQLLSEVSNLTVGSVFTFLYNEGVELQDEQPLVAIIRAIVRGQVKPAALLKITLMLNLDYNTAR